jgi:hypothetical protein
MYARARIVSLATTLGRDTRPTERTESIRGIRVRINRKFEPLQRHGAAVYNDAVEIGYIVAVGLVCVCVVGAPEADIQSWRAKQRTVFWRRF